MKIHELRPAKGAKSNSKRRGRGMGCGIGKTSGKGAKGQKARSGSTTKAKGMEGGQMPIMRRIPKTGFTSINKKEFNVVNIEKLNQFKEESHITPEIMRGKGIIGKKKLPIKVLGKGDLKKKLKISAHAFSAGAKESIEKTGGTIEIIK